jgi:hypothetical protein
MIIIQVVKVILNRQEAKIFLICLATGGTLQILAKKYIKSHPEVLDLESDFIIKKKI